MTRATQHPPGIPANLNHVKRGRPGKTTLLTLITILLLTLFLHLGSLTTDIHHGISDWHPDSARYLVQCREYIKHNYKPIGSTPWYTGNPYANILMLSILWRGLDRLFLWTGFGHIPLTNLNLSLVSRLFYLLLCLLLTLIIYLFASHVFQSPAIGLLSALFWAASPLAINLNHIIKPEIPLTFFITLAAIAAYKLSEKDSFALYVIGGIAAGIAAALKYNGAIVLAYLYLMHAYRIYKSERRKRITISFAFRTFFSARLITAGLCSLLAFYAFEPILWLSLSKGITYIRQYLHTAAYTATPPELKHNHGIRPFLLHSIKTMPHNFSIFVRATHPLILIFVVVGFFLAKGHIRSRQVRIALFPITILAILFMTKPLIGAEFLLHFMPFVFILAALGLYFTYRNISAFRIIGAKVIAFLTIVFTFAFYLYGGLYEIKYFSVGNIRYHAQHWVQKNLKGQCIHIGHHTLLHNQNNCRNKRPVALVTYTKSSFPQKANGITLKTFNLEKKKPIIHLIRGYKIRVVGSKKFFDAPPWVPHVPLTCPPTSETTFVRFLNGVDLNPAYYAYFLHPNTTYAWTIASNRRIAPFTCQFINGDGISLIRSPNLHAPVKLLPYEKRALTVFPTLSFPWRKPYLYTLSFRSTRNLYLKLPLQNSGSGAPYKSMFNTFLPSALSIQNAISYLSTLSSGSPQAFQKTFRSLFRYDFSLLENFLSTTIPIESMKSSTRPNPFFKSMVTGDAFQWTPSPTFCEPGRHVLEGHGDIFLSPGASVTFNVIIAGRILAKKVIKHAEIGTNCLPNYHLTLPFQVPATVPVYFVLAQKGGARVSLKELAFQVPFQSLLKTALEAKILREFLETRSKRVSLSRYVSTFNPSNFSSATCWKVGNAFFDLNQAANALPWLRSAVERDLLNRNAWTLLAKTYQSLSKPKEAQRVEVTLNTLSSIDRGNWKFQTGLALRGYAFSRHVKRRGDIPFTLYLSLPNFNGDLSAFVYFTKNGNIYFGKDFNLFQATPFGAYQKLDSFVHVPEKIPTGTYQVHFTFRMPRLDKRYHLLKNGKPSVHESILFGSIKID